MSGWQGRCAAVLCGVFVWVGALAVYAPGAFAQAPTISSFSPTAGTIGRSITITGSGFTGVSKVTFNGASSSFERVSASEITAKVPPDGSSGPIAVTTQTGTGVSGRSFKVNPSVVLSRTAGPPTSSISVSGAGFGAFEGVDLFFDLTDEAVAGTSATGSFGPISVSVPATAVPGTHWISAQGRRSGNFAQSAFTVRTNWLQFGFGPRHKGYNPYENVLSPSTVSGLDLDWTAATGGPISFSSAAVADGVVYVGSGDGNLYAFPASCAGDATCTPLWHGTTQSSIHSSPTVSGGVVYVGSDDRNLYAFPAACGTGDATCKPLWHGTTQNDIYPSSPTVSGGVVYIASNDGDLYAFPASCGTGDATCTPLWHGTTGASVQSSPAVANGVVYIGSSDGNLYAFPASCGTNDATCTPLWHAAIGATFSSPAVANGVVYIGSSDGNLYAFPASCGTNDAICTPLWHGTTGATRSMPAVANGVVYIGSFAGDLYAFPAACGTGDATCTPLWHGTTGSQIRSSAAVANGVVYIGSNDGNVYAFPAACGTGDATCAPLWAGTTGGIVSSTPAIANGVVYVGSEDGDLYAFDLPAPPLAPARPTHGSLHRNRSLRQQR